MADQNRCADTDRRREEIVEGGTLNGLDDVEVRHDLRQPAPTGSAVLVTTLVVRCLRPVPAAMRAAAIRIDGGVRPDPAINPVGVRWAFPATELAAAHRADPELVTEDDLRIVDGLPDPELLLVVRTSSAGDFSPYRLVVVAPADWGFDPRLAEATFSFKVDCPHDIDPLAGGDAGATGAAPEPTIDYLNRDYADLRRLLLDRLSVVIPPWTDRNAADLGVTLVEIFAYLGDQISYTQDVVGAEAYLGTARRRVSVARHARLLDYPMHQGAAARTWLAVSADRRADGRSLPAGSEVRDADGLLVFHTLHPVTPLAARNAIDIHTWGQLRCWLPAGATRATLVGTRARLGLLAGDVLVFEEIRGASGTDVDVDVTHRCAVRLAADPIDLTDPATGTRCVEVTWYDADALPFDLLLWRFPGPRCGPDLGAAVARGNVVLAEHGALTGPETLLPEVVPESERYRPVLRRRDLTHATPYDHSAARQRPATDALAVSPQTALPQVLSLTDGRTEWRVTRDLLGSDRFAPEFVVEMNDDGQAGLRFGDDVLGRAPTPGDRLRVTYRTGGGRVGNCGRDVLTQLVEPVDGVAVRNPVPAAGGTDPEPVEQVRQWAPQAFRVQQRAVTEADYATIAQRYPGLQRAAATRRWTGSWYTEFVTIDRQGGAEVDAAYREGLVDFLDGYRMAGVDVAVNAPVFVPLDIVFTVCVAPDQHRDAVHADLVDLFSARDLPGGRRGFFHPDNLTFGQPVYLSQLVATAMSVDGVAWVDTEPAPDKPNRFQRWGRPAAGEHAAGWIPLGRLEVARCDSDPNQPEHGRIDFVLRGGL